MPTQVTEKLAYYYKNGQLYRVGGGEEGSGTFMSFDISDATEETVDNIPGYTWDLTEEQFYTLCDPAMQSVTVDIVIPGEGEANQHYIFHRDAAASVGVLGSAFFFAVDTSQATTDVVGTAMRLRVYRNVTWLKLRIEALGEIMTSDAVTSALSSKANASDVYTKTQVDASLSGKVDKVNGKGLSTNDFTDDEKTKLAGIAAGAQVNTVNKVNNKTGDVTITKGDLSLGNVENKSTATIKSEFTGSVATGDTGFVTGGAVKTYVDNAINSLPEPMVFKGTLGTGGTITSLPAAASSNEGFTYKVITAGTYASQAAKVGDVFVSNGSAWVLIPAGDDVEDTWRRIRVNGTALLDSGISSGDVNFKNGSNVTITGSGNNITISSTDTDTGATSVAVSGSGNVVSDASYDASTRKITLSKGVTALTSHQAVKTLKTDNTTAQSTSSGETIVGSGTISLHKVAKTGTYGDLLGKPSLATVATSGSYNDLSNKPTIPTVNNATLTIQKNGTTVSTFTANASSNVTANITVPTVYDYATKAEIDAIFE